MANEKDMSSIFAAMNKILDNTDLTNVTSESEGFDELPEGFFLTEVVSAELTTSKKTGNPMASFRLKTVEDGYDIDINPKDGKQVLRKLAKTKGQYQNLFYVFKEERDIRRFAKDMLKFEEKPGVPFIDKEIFMQAELIGEALPLLAGKQLYIQVSVSEKEDGTTSKWVNFISWQRAKQFELPVD